MPLNESLPSRMMYGGWTTARRSAVPVKQIKLPSDSVRADLCLGLTVTGLYTLITMGLIILFI